MSGRSSSSALFWLLLPFWLWSGPGCSDGSTPGSVDGGVTPDGGEGGDGGDEGAPKAIFVVPREGAERVSWDLPFPSDLDRTETGVDLSAFPNPVHSSAIDMFVDLLGTEVDGFSTIGSCYLRFSTAIDVGALPDPAGSLDPGASVFLVRLSTGERVPVVLRFQESATDYWGDDTLAARAVNGFVLAPAETYALVVTRDLTTVDGTPFGASPDLRAILGLETGDPATEDARARVYGPAATRLAELGTPADEIVSLSVFTTQDPVGPMFRAAQALRRDVPEPDATEYFSDRRLDTYTLLTGHYGPAPLYQTGVAPFDAVGSGRFEWVDGEPVVQEEAVLRFAVAVPVTEMPASGYPIVVTSHGTGGDYKSFVEDGTARRLAELGVASIGFDQVLHGERAPPDTQPETTFFNFTNPVAGRDNARQSALDNVQQARLVRNMVIPADTLPSGAEVFFDPSHVAFFGHSQGSLNGALFLAIDETAHAAILSGSGANIGYAILYKTEPTSILPLVEILLDLDAETEGFDIFHPILTLLQTFIDTADPLNYAPYWSAEPRVGDGRSVLVTEGLDDTFAPPLGAEGLAVAAGIPLLGDVSRPIPGLDLEGLATSALPATANVTSGTGVTLTSGIWQVPGYGHFAVYDEPGLAAAAPAFLASALSAPPGVIPAP